MILTQVGWGFHSSVLIGMALWTAAYVLVTGPWRSRYGWGDAPGPLRATVFHFGTLVGLLALSSPLDPLGDDYLFSAHMLQHLLLMYVTAPCWLLGTPGWLPGLLIPRRLQAAARRVTSPAVALCVFAGVTLGWHVPGVYSLAQAHEWLHIVEHLTFIGAALIGWWPIAGPASVSLPRSPAPIRMLYIFFMAMPCTLLGAILTFAGRPLYSYYVQAPHPFGLGVLDDQRLGGLLMWVPTHVILLVCLSIIAGNWLSSQDTSPNLPADNPAS